MLLAPSIQYVVFLYLPTYLINVIQVFIRDLGDKDPAFYDLVFDRVAVGFGMLILWYILQKRELTRFFDLRQIENREIKAVKKQN